LPNVGFERGQLPAQSGLCLIKLVGSLGMAPPRQAVPPALRSMIFVTIVWWGRVTFATWQISMTLSRLSRKYPQV